LVTQTLCNQGHAQTHRVFNERERVKSEGIAETQPLTQSSLVTSSHSQPERRERDLNPRTGYPVGGVQDREADDESIWKDRKLRQPSDRGCTLVAQPREMPADLARVVEVWDSLPAPIKAAILAMVNASEK
jgi:hypothetical protein